MVFFKFTHHTTHTTHTTTHHTQPHTYSNDVVGVADGAVFLATLSQATRADAFFANKVLALLTVHVVPVRVHIPIVRHTLAHDTWQHAHSAVVIHASGVAFAVALAEKRSFGESLGGSLFVSLFVGLFVGLAVGTRVDEGRFVNLQARLADPEPTAPALRDSGRD